MADDDAAIGVALAWGKAASFDHVFHAHGLIIDGRNHERADVAQAAFFLVTEDPRRLRRVGHAQHLLNGIFAAAE